MAQRLIGLDLHIILGQQFPQLPLLEEGVALHLVHRREGLELGNELLPDLRRHVAHADGPDLARGLGLLQGLPGARHIAVGLVEQVEVHIVHPQLLQRGVQALLCRLIAVVLEPQLAGDENLLPGDAAVPDRPAHIRFVEVGGRRVDVPVPGVEGRPHRVVGGTVGGD